MKNQSLNRPALLLLLLLLSGCRVTIDNMTPSCLPQNSSDTYTMTMAVHVPEREVLAQSLRPFIVIDGKRQPMKRSELGRNIFVYDGRIPAPRDRVSYYYELEYEVASGRGTVTGMVRSRLYEFRISGRCALSLDVYRGIAGTRVVLLGRGFQGDDRVIFDDMLADTQIHSDHMLEFTVPPVEGDRNYHLTLQGSHGPLDLGDFFVDLAPIHASVDALLLRARERQSFSLCVDHPVPSNGLILDVTTDIPEDIVIPEVLIPGGSTSVEALISGNGHEASGHLFVEAKGYQPLVIPVQVIGKARRKAAMASPDQALAEADSVGFSSEGEAGADAGDMIVVE